MLSIIPAVLFTAIALFQFQRDKGQHLNAKLIHLFVVFLLTFYFSGLVFQLIEYFREFMDLAASALFFGDDFLLKLYFLTDLFKYFFAPVLLVIMLIMALRKPGIRRIFQWAIAIQVMVANISFGLNLVLGSISVAKGELGILILLIFIPLILAIGLIVLYASRTMKDFFQTPPDNPKPEALFGPSSNSEFKPNTVD